MGDRQMCWCAAHVLEQRERYCQEHPVSPIVGTFVFFTTAAERELHCEWHLQHLGRDYRFEYSTPCRTRGGPLRYPVWVQWARLPHHLH